jgi:uncharacterized protein YukE
VINDQSGELAGLEASRGRLRQGVARLIDSYAEGLIEKTEFDPRIKRLKERLKQLEEQIRQIQDEEGMERQLQLIIGRLETFAAQITGKLHEADWHTRRELIRLLVKRVEIDQEQVHVIFRVGPTTPSTPSDHYTQSLQHWGGACVRRSSQTFISTNSTNGTVNAMLRQIGKQTNGGTTPGRSSEQREEIWQPCKCFATLTIGYGSYAEQRHKRKT